MRARARRTAHRPLLSGGGLVGLTIIALLTFLALLPLSLRRQRRASVLAPTALSMTYLELSLVRRPDDAALRLEITRKRLQLGHFEQARHTLRPLLTAAHPPLEALLLRIDIDRHAWAAIDARDGAAKQRARERLLADLHAVDTKLLSPKAAEAFVRAYLQAEQPAAAAEILEELARRSLPDAESRLADADAAWLAAGQPARAAQLLASFSRQPDVDRSHYARLAVQRARATGQPKAAQALFLELHAEQPDDLALLELGLAVSEEVDPRAALALAQQLLARSPRDPMQHRRVARLAEATGNSLRALDEYVWLTRHGGTADDRARALELARANWDLALVRELVEGTKPPTPAPRTPRPRRRCGHAERRQQRRDHALQERVQLYEALGDGRAAIVQLTEALAADAADAQALLAQKYELELRTGDDDAALTTLMALRQRFPSRAVSQRLAQRQLELGQTKAALETLWAAPGEHDAETLRALALLAREVGDRKRERLVYAALLRDPSATRWDFQRAWSLADAASDRDAALHLALHAFARFGSAEMLMAAANGYAALGNETKQLQLLSRGEVISSLAKQVSFWQLRITLYQRRAGRAAERHAYTAAKNALQKAETLLTRAAQHAPADELYAQLWAGQHAQSLALALACNDLTLLGATYPRYANKLSLRERVYVLGKLGRTREALDLALDGARNEHLPETDRSALEADARGLTVDLAQNTRAGAEMTSMDGLFTWRSAASAEYASALTGLRGEASFTQFRSQGGVFGAELNDVGAELGGRWHGTSLRAGAVVRADVSARPYGVLAQQLFGDRRAGLAAAVHIDDRTVDTARLRALGVRDALSLDGTLPFAGRFQLSARALAERFYEREQRRYLGSGVTLDAALGANFTLPDTWGAASLRLATHSAQRFDQAGAHSAALKQPSQPWLGHSTTWLGIGAALGRGQLDTPPLLGRELCYMLDASAGWVLPDASVGWSAQVGAGISLFGADLLTLAARSGNVIGVTNARTSVLSANLGYAVSFGL